MPKKVKNTKRSALWVMPVCHKLSSICSTALGISIGEFVEDAICYYVEKNDEIEFLREPLLSLYEEESEENS